jgi:hypothetical protein
LLAPSDDLHLSRARGQRSRNVVLLEHGERSDEPLARLVTRGDALRKSLRAAKGVQPAEHEEPWCCGRYGVCVEAAVPTEHQGSSRPIRF